jgi:uncharacterized protein YjbI with pentapeptide repeats
MGFFSTFFGFIAPAFDLTTEQFLNWVDRDTATRNARDKLEALPDWFNAGLNAEVLEGGYKAQEFRKWFEKRKNYDELYELIHLSSVNYQDKLSEICDDLNQKTAATSAEQQAFNLQKTEEAAACVKTFREKQLDPDIAYVLAEFRKRYTANHPPQPDKQESWNEYNAFLKAEVKKPMFGENFSIEDLYIPLCAYYEKDPEPLSPEARKHGEDEKESVLEVVDVETELRAWIEDENGKQICELVGGPGSGKSTVTKIFASSILDEIPTVYVPLGCLSDWSGEKSVRSTLETYFRDNSPYKPGDLSFETRSLLILDGIDELRVTTSDIAHFLSLLSNFINSHKLTKVLLSSREHYAEKVGADLAGMGVHKLNLLGYRIDNQNIYTDPGGLLSVDRRGEWWKRYGELKELNFENGFPKEVADWDKKEKLTHQPLLNYIVATTFVLEGSTFKNILSLYGLYEKLVEVVFDRDYDLNLGKHSSVKTPRIQKEDFYRFLTSAALAMWHEGGSVGSYRRLEQYCEADEGIKRILADIQGNSTDDKLISLLISFFTKPSSSQGYEFTHQSFMEFLVARALVSWLKGLPGDPDAAMIEWGKLTGWQPLTPHMLDFLKAAIVEEKLPEAEGKFDQAIELMEGLLTNGVPLEKEEETRFEVFYDRYRYEGNAETAFFVLLGFMQAIAKKKYSLNHIFMETQFHVTYRVWQSFIKGKNYTNSNNVLYYFSLVKANLYGVDLSGVDLSGVVLASADITCAYLSGADLSGADLTYANLTEVNTSDWSVDSKPHQYIAQSLRVLWIGKLTNLSHANLSNAILARAFLMCADLSHANLSHANLSDADLTSANLTGAHLSHANLSGVVLTSANLTGADFRQTLNLTKEQLKYAKYDKRTTKIDEKLWDEMFPKEEWPWWGPNKRLIISD